MVNNLNLHRKNNGVYYTPPYIAEFLISSFIKKSNISILDPAYGNGALLLAIDRVYKKNRLPKKGYPKIYGCDNSPHNGCLHHLKKARLITSDFFDYYPHMKFDFIVMNPPYVRHHRINKAKRDEYHRKTKHLCTLKLTSDLWGYFLVKSTSHLKIGGCIGAILPWSFLQAKYAHGIRSWLYERFRHIRILALGSRYFKETNERVLLVWLENYGQKTKSIRIAFSKNLDSQISYTKLNKCLWTASVVNYSEKNDINFIVNEYIEKYGFRRLGDYANVKIGVVTGADKFFIMTGKEAKKHGFSSKNLIAIITTFKECSQLYLDGIKLTKKLLLIPELRSQDYKDYIKEGKRKKYHLRAHALLRDPWYTLNVQGVPHAFFPYRIAHTPYFVLNSKRIQCTNSIHRVYFKNLSENQMRWIQISALSVPGQLSLEYLSKTYGRNMLKIEPCSLKNTIVHKGIKKIPDSVYKKINELIALNMRKNAMAVATQFINKTFGISNSLSRQSQSALNDLQTKRFS